MIKQIFTFIILFIFVSVSYAKSDDGYFASSSENGITGIFVTPTARLMPENHFRISYFRSNPYINYAVGVSLFDRIEFSGRVTEIDGVDMRERGGADWEDYGNYKDKFVAGKLQIWKENKYRPALAVGLSDPHGTKLFGSQYIVASKQIYPFDFSFGLGLGRFGDKPFYSYGKKDILKNFIKLSEYKESGNPFFSLQFRPSEKYSLLYEYNPIEYRKKTEDPAVKEGVVDSSSKHSFGMRYYFNDNFYATVSHQRGDTVGIGVTFPFEIGRAVIPIYTPKPIIGSLSKEARGKSRLRHIMQVNQFGSPGAMIVDGVAYIEITNSRFFFEMDSIEYAVRVLGLVNNKAGYIHKYVFIVRERGVPIYSFEVSQDVVDLYEQNKLTRGEMLRHVKIDRSYRNFHTSNRRFNIDYYYGVKPQVNFFLNDPSGFFKGSMGAKGWVGKYLTESLSLVGGLGYYPVNTVDSANETPDNAVRSDISEFLDRRLLLENLQLDYIARIPHTKLYFNAEGGILETQYAGVHAEVATHFFKDKLLLGLSGHRVKKRDKDSYYEIDKNSDNYSTYFLKTRVTSKRLKSYIEVHAGKFLGGDKGAKVILTKNIKGVLLTAWYTKTDTDVFTESYNRGYSDKGISVTVPFRLFKGKDTRSTYSQSISPWTRDVGAQVGEFTNIFNFIGKSPYELR